MPTESNYCRFLISQSVIFQLKEILALMSPTPVLKADLNSSTVSGRIANAFTNSASIPESFYLEKY